LWRPQRFRKRERKINRKHKIQTFEKKKRRRKARIFRRRKRPTKKTDRKEMNRQIAGERKQSVADTQLLAEVCVR
jgi:hypothetical protein